MDEPGHNFQTEIVDVINSDEMDQSIDDHALDNFNIELNMQENHEETNEHYNILDDNQSQVEPGEASADDEIAGLRPLAKITNFLQKDYF